MDRPVPQQKCPPQALQLRPQSLQYLQRPSYRSWAALSHRRLALLVLQSAEQFQYSSMHVSSENEEGKKRHVVDALECDRIRDGLLGRISAFCRDCCRDDRSRHMEELLEYQIRFLDVVSPKLASRQPDAGWDGHYAFPARGGRSGGSFRIHERHPGKQCGWPPNPRGIRQGSPAYYYGALREETDQGRMGVGSLYLTRWIRRNTAHLHLSESHEHRDERNPHCVPRQERGQGGPDKNPGIQQ